MKLCRAAEMHLAKQFSSPNVRKHVCLEEKLIFFSVKIKNVTQKNIIYTNRESYHDHSICQNHCKLLLLTVLCRPLQPLKISLKDEKTFHYSISCSQNIHAILSVVCQLRRCTAVLYCKSFRNDLHLLSVTSFFAEPS